MSRWGLTLLASGTVAIAAGLWISAAGPVAALVFVGMVLMISGFVLLLVIGPDNN